METAGFPLRRGRGFSDVTQKTAWLRVYMFVCPQKEALIKSSSFGLPISCAPPTASPVSPERSWLYSTKEGKD
jgi:hypothetical protein